MNEKIKAYYTELYRKVREEGQKLSEGELYAMNAYRYSVSEKSNELECNEMPWKTDMSDFVESLRKAGAEQIAITDHSTALMENLHKLAKQGCTIDGFCTVTKEGFWGGEEEIPAIRINLN